MATTDVDVTASPPLVAPPASSTVLGLPINRVVAFLGPYLAILSGAVADWLMVHVHLLSLFHTTSTTVAGAITQLGVFGLTSILVWLGHHKWLTGWQQFQAAVASPTASGPSTPAAEALQTLQMGDYDPTTAGQGYAPVPGAEAPDDEVEMAEPGQEVELDDDGQEIVSDDVPELVDDPAAIEPAPAEPTEPFTARRRPPPQGGGS